MTPKAPRWMRALGFPCAGIIVFILVREVGLNWTALKNHPWELSLPLGLVSFAGATGSLFFLPWGVKQVLALLDHPLPYWRASRILFASLMAKYLPGGWWALVGRAHLYRLEGLALPQASVAVFIETILSVASGIFVFSFFFLFFAYRGGLELFWIPVGAACLSLIHPFFLNRVLSLAKRITGKPMIHIHYPFGRILLPFAVFSLFWIGMGGSFWLLAGSLMGIKLSLFAPMVGAFSLSWILGFVSFLTPGGLGVREGSLAFLLQPHLPLYAAAVLAILSRIWWIGGEVLGLGISYGWDWLTRDKRRAAPPKGSFGLRLSSAEPAKRKPCL